MTSISSSLLCLILAVACVSNSYLATRSATLLVAADQQPVFVLETSDSESSASQPSSSAAFQADEPSSSSSSQSSNTNTHIITDDNTSQSTNNNQYSSSTPVRNKQQSSNEQQSQVVPHSVTHSSNSPVVVIHSSSSNSDKQQQQTTQNSATVRRLDDAPANQKLTNTRSTLTQQQQQQQKPKQTSTQTYNSNTNYDQTSSQQAPPKTEERLLISITSEEDEYKPPQRQVIATPGGFDEIQGPSTLSQQQQQQQQQPQQHQNKKKPAITISIQDNSNKQGGSGTPSVILRPSENGQSIIISTLGSSAIESGHNNNNNNKYNPNKPAIAIVSSNGHQINNEPIEIHGTTNHHNNNNNPISTHRPFANNNNNNNNNEYNIPINKPIVSTLIDQPRPPVNVMTQRPPLDVSDYEQPPRQPPISSPVRPQQQQSTAAPIHTRPPPAPISNDYNNENTGSGSDFVATEQNQNQKGGSKYPLNEKNCGVLHETKIVGGDEADPNDFLWMAAIIKSRPTNDGEVRPFCGGSLITRRHILTAAHCLDNLAPRDVLVRLGSYDFDDSTASSSSSDYAIDQFRKPAQYSKKTHVADIAIMRLKTPLQLNDNYRTVCMPQARRSYVGALGTVTGYGSQSQTFRRATPKLRQVTVPIWENRKCSAVYKRNLTESFLCAGYDEGGKDACQGDSGGPLMTDGPNDRTIVVGVVSHGIGCGSPGYPGVYTRISTFLDWIEENTKE